MALLDLKVSPKASRAGLSGWLGETLKLSVTAAPERGKANAAVEELLAQALDLPRASVRVVAGHAARNKRVDIAGLQAAELRARIEAALAAGGRRR